MLVGFSTGNLPRIGTFTTWNRTLRTVHEAVLGHLLKGGELLGKRQKPRSRQPAFLNPRLGSTEQALGEGVGNGEGLAKGWQRVGGFPCTLQFLQFPRCLFRRAGLRLHGKKHLKTQHTQRTQKIDRTKHLCFWVCYVFGCVLAPS